MYSPIIGRFLTEDPLGDDSGDSNFYRYCVNNPVNLVDPSGLETDEERRIRKTQELKGHQPLGTGNTGKDAHDEAIKRKGKEKAKKEAAEAEAKARKAAGQQQLDQSKKARQIHEGAVKDSLGEIDAEKRALDDQIKKYKNPNNIKSKELQQQISLLDDEAQKIRQNDEAMKRVPDARFSDELKNITERVKPQKYLQKVARVLGRGIAVGSFVVGVIQFRETMAEEGLGRAVVDTIPVLSDVVSLTEDYVAMHEAVQETIKAYDEAERSELASDKQGQSFVRKTAIKWYKEAASDIEIRDAARVDTEAIGRAVQIAANEISALQIVMDRIPQDQRKQRIDEIKARLKGALREAARQSDSSESIERPIS